jgi:hypothetical protein
MPTVSLRGLLLPAAALLVSAAPALAQEAAVPAPAAAAAAPALAPAPAAAAGAATAARPAARRSNRNALSADELRDSQEKNLYDAIRRMRYFWMQGRGAGSFSQPEVVQVYVNGQHAEGASALRQIDPSTVVSVDYLSGIDATSRYGTGHGAGAIIVRTGT